MLQAQLRGKLDREEENLEDLLTSNVFGSISYVPLDQGLGPLLTNSQDSNGNLLTLDLQPASKVVYEFWPWIEEKGCKGCQPDVCITIHLSDGTKTIIFVEAKFLSGKSSEAEEEEATPYDQLAREWDNLQELSAREAATPIFLYITADLSYPAQDFLDSKQDYMKHRKKEMSMFWISWRTLPGLFSNRKHDNLRRDILCDLIEVLRRLDLTFFDGITIPELRAIAWSFEVIEGWDWKYRLYNITWKYSDSKN